MSNIYIYLKIFGVSCAYETSRTLAHSLGRTPREHYKLPKGTVHMFFIFSIVQFLTHSRLLKICVEWKITNCLNVLNCCDLVAGGYF